MKISGIVRNASGRALAGARLVALGAAQEVICEAQANAAGAFVLTGDGIVMVHAFGPDWLGPAVRVRSLPRLWRVPGSPRPASVQVELTLRACRPIVLRAFTSADSAGGPGVRLDDPKPENARQLSFCWFRDMAGKVAPGAFRWREGDGGPWIFLPEHQPTRLEVLWPAPGFGAVVCHAANGADGFAAGGQAKGLTTSDEGILELWLNEELAVTACARLDDSWDRAHAADYAFASDVTAHRDAARAHLAAMQAIAVDGESACAQRAAHADAALAEALWGHENLVIQQAAQDIPRHRHQNHVLTVRLPDGTPATGAEVCYTQTAHEFRFGIFVNPVTHPVTREPFDGELWTALKDLGINQVTLPFLWSRHEPERGRRRDAEQDAIFPAAELAAAGFRLKGHISVWPWHGRYPDQWDAFTPEWLYQLSPREVQEAGYDHHKALVAYNREHVEGFQAINEPMLSHTNAVNLTLPETLELVRRSSGGIRAGGSTGPIEVNNCCVFAESVNADIREQGYERMPYEFFEDLETGGVPYDVVGIQLYYGGYMVSRLFQGGFPIRHLADISDLIDRYSQFDKPVNVSEVSVPSSAPPPDGPYVGEWHGPWTMKRQAEWVRSFYTLCYSKQQVREISWWNATDEAAFVHTGGLMTDDYRPKPAFFALRELIQGWKVHGETRVTSAGAASLWGPAGEYEVEITHEGQAFGPYSVRLGPQPEDVILHLVSDRQSGLPGVRARRPAGHS